ncbi:MAG TPA: hypothetical protein VGY98_00655 [Verrucomicrobiae bacterium]|nr:hypothetical protein [Verrucomicrobiae bacterium]
MKQVLNLKNREEWDELEWQPFVTVLRAIAADNSVPDYSNPNSKTEAVKP